MSDARTLCREGLQLFIAHRLDEAVAVYRRAIELDPAFPLAWNGLSKSLERAGDLEGALQAAKRLAELEPDDPLTHTNLSQLHQRLGKIPEAEEAKARAMSLQMRQQRR